MPEGDTLFRAARALHRGFAGKTVTGFQTAYAQLAAVDDQSPVVGRRVERVQAVGKHLLMFFSGDLVLHSHLRMNGSWHIYRPGEKWSRAQHRMRVVLQTAELLAVGFDLPVAEFLTGEKLRRHPDLAKLGPDLLGEAFDPEEVLRRFRERNPLPIEEAVLNQRVMAGAGNVFKSEVLFLRAIHPRTPVALVSDEALTSLIALSQKLLRANVADNAPGAIITYTGMRRTTGRADPSERLWVYGRGGLPCRRCATPIEVAHWGEQARITYWCPTCQPAPQPQPQPDV